MIECKEKIEVGKYLVRYCVLEFGHKGKHEPPLVTNTASHNSRPTKARITVIKEVDASLKPEIVMLGKDIREVRLPKGIAAYCHICEKGFASFEDCILHNHTSLVEHQRKTQSIVKGVHNV